VNSKLPAVILFIVAFVQLGLAVLFLFMSRWIPIAGKGLIPAGVVLGVVGFGLLAWGIAWWKKAANAQRLLAVGEPGQAWIMALSQTGVYVNNNPQVQLQLRVQTASHGFYEVTRKEVVPMLMIGRITNGHPLPVKVDPQNPHDLVIDWAHSLQPASPFAPR
jgi:hypothetical protein